MIMNIYVTQYIVIIYIICVYLDNIMYTARKKDSFSSSRSSFVF